MKKLLAGVVLFALCLTPFGCSPGSDSGDDATPGPIRTDLGTRTSAASSDVVLIVLNGVRAPSLGLYGNTEDPMPFLTELGENSVVFDYCTANGFWFYSSMPSLLTGLYPAHHGSTLALVDDDYVDVLPDDRTTLAEQFAQAGYDTAFYSALSLYEERELGLLQGFESLVLPSELEVPAGEEGGAVLRAQDEALVERVLAEVPDGNPTFTLVHLNAAYSPLGVQDTELGDFVRQDELDAYMDQFGPTLGFGKNQHELVRQDPEFLDILRRLYQETLQSTDERLRELVTRYGEARPGTLFVITSDHGQLLMEKDAGHLFGDQVIPYNFMTHVPLVFHQAGTLEPRRIDTPVMLADIQPTLAAMRGLKTPGMTDGVSLASAVRTGDAGRELRDRFIFAHSGNIFQTYAILQDNYKLIDIIPTSVPALWLMSRAANPEMLYLGQGQEAVNLVYSFPDKARELRNAANQILTGRHGNHLVVVGDGEPRGYEGMVASDAAIDRHFIRYHNDTWSFDRTLATSPDYAQRFTLASQPELEPAGTDHLYNLTLEPESERTLTFRTDGVPGVDAGKPFALSFGFQFQASPEQTVQVLYRNPRYTNTNTIKGQGDEEAWYAADYLALVGQTVEITLTNNSSEPVEITHLFALPAEAAARAVQKTEQSLTFDFQLAEGMVDLNWQHMTTPAEWNLSMIEAGAPLHVWSGGKFTALDGNSLTVADLQSASLADAPAIARALREAADTGEAGLYFYQLGEPHNTRTLQ